MQNIFIFLRKSIYYSLNLNKFNLVQIYKFKDNNMLTIINFSLKVVKYYEN